MRKVLSALIVVGVTLGGYFLGVAPTTAQPGHSVTPAPPGSLSITEGNAGTTNVVVTLNISPIPEAGEEVSVDFGCNDGTATDGGTAPDYACDPNTVASPNTIKFTTATGAQQTFTAATVNGDTTSEQSETFSIVLFNVRCTAQPTNPASSCGVAGDNPADVPVTIVNDDQVPGNVTVGDAASPEGNNTQTKDITFTVTLSRPCTAAQGNLDIAFATAGITATEGTDYTAATGTLTFTPGQTTKTVVVKTIGDNAGESNETFTLTLTPQAGTCKNSFDVAEPPSDLKATGTITDDDGPPGTAVNTGCSGNASGDFNGDGRDDLAVGIPGQAVGAKGNAGAVQVIYGSLTTGLVDIGKQLITQGADSVDGAFESGDEFGACLAAGNFNGDTFGDLAIGVPGEDITSTRGNFSNAGAVNVIYGTSSGLNAAGSRADQIWAQDSPGVLGGSEASDALGAALTAGDFNNDGRDDLAIGVAAEDIGNRSNAGAVNVLPGSSDGLSATGDQLWFQNVKNVAGASENEDGFGADLAAGDLDGNGRDDLVVGVPGEAIGTTAKAGAIHVIRSGNAGLSRALDRIWFSGNSSVVDTSEANDGLGATVAVGDFDNDGFADIAAGVPREDLNSKNDIGAVVVLYSTSTGPAGTDSELWTENDSTKITGETSSAAGDLFGAALTAGDFNNDSLGDLAIGVPQNDFGGTNAGAVHVLYGASAGLGSAQRFNQGDVFGGTDPPNEGAEPEDAFGSALSNGDYNGDDKADLAIGVPKEDIASPAATDGGAVNIVVGGTTQLVLTGGQYFTQESGTDQASGSQSGDQYAGSVG